MDVGTGNRICLLATDLLVGFPVGLLTFPRAVLRGGTLGTPLELNGRLLLVAGVAGSHSEMSRCVSVSAFSLGVLGLLSDKS